MTSDIFKPELDIEYRIRNENNRKEKCEDALNKVSYNGKYAYNFFPVNKEKLIHVIENWQIEYPELKNELEYWKFSDKGSKFTNQQTVFPLHRGKKIECGFLKIYESGGDDDVLYCISIVGSISIRSTRIINRAFGLVGLRDECEKKCINMIKSHPKIMAALIMSESSGLRIRWEGQDVSDEPED